MNDRVPTIDDRCGTPAGYQAHRKRGEAACGPCRNANAAYMRVLRADRADLRERERARQNARDRATQRLIDAHRAEWAGLVQEELA